jgi:MFS family permease
MKQPLSAVTISPEEKPRLWTANYILACLSSFTVMTAFTAMFPTLPIYIEQYGGLKGIAGLPLTALTLGAVATRPFAGWALDRFNRKLILLGGLILFLIPAILFVWMLPAVAFIFFRLIQGMGWGICNTALSTIASDVIPPQRMGEGLGYFTISLGITMAYSPAVAFLILEFSGFPIFFMAASALILLATIMAAAIKYSPAAAKAKTLPKPVFIERSALRPAVMMLLVTLNYGAVVSFVSVHAINQGVPNAWIFFSALAVTIIAVRPLAGIIMDQNIKFRISLTIMAAVISIAAAMTILARTTTMAHLTAGGFFYGLGYGILMPVMLALCLRGSPLSSRGAANATYWIAYDLGVALGSALWGLLAALTGYGIMFMFTIIPPAIVLAIYFLDKPVRHN